MSRKLLILSMALTVGSCGFLLLNIITSHPIQPFLIKICLAFGASATLSLWIMRKFFGEKRSDHLVVNLMVLVLTVGILFAGSEFVVRSVFKDITTTSDNASYFARRWKERTVHLNSLGFREREVSSAKMDGVYRIAVIGDSLTYGQGIAEKERFTNLLEEALNSRGKRYEVLNFGRAGAETIDEIDTLRNIVLKTKPDFILLQWFINDFDEHKRKVEDVNLSASFLLVQKRVHSKLLASSALYYLINRKWKSLGTNGGLGKQMLQNYGDPNNRESRRAAQTVRSFIRLCKDHHVPVGIVLFPYVSPELRENYPFDFLHDRVLEICAQEGITCADLRSTFAADSDYRKFWVNKFDPHYSFSANILAAEQIMKTYGRIFEHSSGREFHKAGLPSGNY